MKNFIPVILFLFVFGCSQNSPDERVVVEVDGQKLTIKMIRESVDSGMVLTSNFIMEYASQWATEQVLYKEANQKGFDKTEKVEKALEETMRGLAIQELLNSSVYSITTKTISDSVILKNYTSSDLKNYLKNDIVLISYLVFDSKEKANKFKNIVSKKNNWGTEINNFSGPSTANFEMVYKDEASLPYIWKKISELKQKEVSSVIESPIGFVVVRLWQKYYSGDKAPFDYIEPTLRNDILREENRKRYYNYIASLSKKYRVTYLFSDSL
ncbi:MAG: peptidylprolyl isomerase [Bacteroidetes bacterium]|nr:peptidylprolyl isomerase [Bacteroidota bacterium]